MTTETTAPPSAPVTTEAPTDATTTNENASPNDNWEKDPTLDANGNPLSNPVSIEAEDTTEVESGVVTTTEDTTTVDNAVTEKAVTDTANELAQFFTDADLNITDVAKQVTQDGSLSIETYKALVTKHGEGVASLIKDKVMTMHQQSQTLAKEKDTAVFTQVQEAFKDTTEQGGEDTWKELSTWAKSAIPKAERAEINALLKQGGMATKLAVSSLIERFKSSDSFVQVEQLEQADGLSDDYGVGSLDKAGYDRELRKLLDAGHDYATSPEIASLDTRRMKAIRRGR